MNTPDTRERRCDGRQCDGAEGVSMPSPASTRNDPRERGGCVLAWRCARGETMISRVSLGKFTLWSLSISFSRFHTILLPMWISTVNLHFWQSWHEPRAEVGPRTAAPGRARRTGGCRVRVRC